MIINKEKAEHYIWGGICDGWHYLKTDSLSVIREKMPAGASEQKHKHDIAQQFFFILEGSAEFHINNEVYHVNKDEGLHIPPGTEHCICNRTDKNIEFIVISQPKSHGDRVNLK
jgi:mannose-6-phosphate isomerase-like protein (cupin superfamily)